MAYSWNDTSKPDVRYAIVGNGFDLECGLHTGYDSFLKFVREDGYASLPVGASLTNSIDWQGFRSHNYWLKRFESVQIGSGWVDFENEIARVIVTVEKGMANASAIQAFLDDDIKWNSLIRSLSIFGELYNFFKDDGAPIQSYRDLVKRLLDDLRYLTRCLEAYLRDYVCTKPPKETAATKALVRRLCESDRARVISFNYTRTFEQMLKSKGVDCEFCYVHGAIGDGSKKNTMVLGVDANVEPDGATTPVEFGPFMKYNQRIFKQTDNRYMTWLDNVRSSHEGIRQLKELADRFVLAPSSSVDMGATLDRIEYLKSELRKELRKSEVVVFGHSLGLTDRDILKSFITLPDTRTVVYYHDEKSFSSQVSNLSSILGADELITRTGGEARTLEFRDQREQSRSSFSGQGPDACPP